jgi:hypothetical protein
MIVRRRRYWWGLMLCSVIVTACAGQPANQAENAAKWDAAYDNVVAASGESEATDALVARLRVSCNLPKKAVNPIPALTDQAGPFATDAYGLIPYETADACVRARVVAAFDALEGEPFCNQRPDTGSFVACIINGAFSTRLAKKLGVSMTAAERWNPPLDESSKIDKALFDKTFMQCWRQSQAEADRCGDDIYLPLFEIERKDISKCPHGILRGMCIGKVALAQFVNKRVGLIF